MNRVLSYLPVRCPHCTAQQTLDRLAVECESIEMAAGDVFEFFTPGLAAFLEGNREVGLLINLESDPAAIGDDLTAFAVVQLRGMARELTTAADRLEMDVQS